MRKGYFGVMFIAASGETYGTLRKKDPELDLADQVSFEELTAFIKGPLECISLGPNKWGYLHEEGKYNALPVNKMATDLFSSVYGEGRDVIVGPVVLIYDGSFE